MLKVKDKEQIKKAIVEAIVFFDLFGVSLTAWEIWQSLRIRISFSELLDVLENDLPGNINKENNLYFLNARQGLIDNRREQFDLIEKKSRIARKASRILRLVNGIRMVAVCNNFYYKKDSDVDVFIIVRDGRIWTSRLLATLLIHLSGLRRYGKNIKDRICLSFYMSDKDLDFKRISLDGGDPYMEYWLKYLRPIYNDDIYKKLIKDNYHLRERFPNIIKQNPTTRELTTDDIFSKIIKKLNSLWFDSFMGDIIEKILKNIQLRKMSGNTESLAHIGDGRVIISDQVLKFHENDRRQEIKDSLNKKLQELYEGSR